MSSYEDLWYAAKSTRIVYMPPKVLETFGETSVFYLVLAEDMDQPDKLHLRRGLVSAARPRIITPHYFLNQAISNFGEEARQYFSQVISAKDGARFLEYGLSFQKQEHQEEIVSGQLQEVAEQAGKDAQDNMRELRGVIIAVDDTWEISLLYFITELVKRSVFFNARDLARRGLLEMGNGIPIAVRQELDEAFSNCQSLAEARALGARLRDYGVFEEFEDRFYDLYRKMKTI